MAKRTNQDVLALTEENGKDQIRLEYNKLKKAALTLRALDHPVRKQMVSMIEAKKKLSVTDLHVKLKLEQSVASQHLAVLRKAKIVTASREGKFICYSVNQKRLAEIAVLIKDLAQNV